MKFIKGIEVSLDQTMGLYELNDSEQSEMNGRYALFMGVLSEYALEKMSHVDLLKRQMSHYYEGVFQTEKEAEYFAKSVELAAELERFKNMMEKIKTFEPREIHIVAFE